LTFTIASDNNNNNNNNNKKSHYKFHKFLVGIQLRCLTLTMSFLGELNNKPYIVYLYIWKRGVNLGGGEVDIMDHFGECENGWW